MILKHVWAQTNHELIVKLSMYDSFTTDFFLKANLPTSDFYQNFISKNVLAGGQNMVLGWGLFLIEKFRENTLIGVSGRHVLNPIICY